MSQPDFEQLLEYALDDYGGHVAEQLASNTTDDDKSKAHQRALDSRAHALAKYNDTFARMERYHDEWVKAQKVIKALEADIERANRTPDNFALTIAQYQGKNSILADRCAALEEAMHRLVRMLPSDTTGDLVLNLLGLTLKPQKEPTT